MSCLAKSQMRYLSNNDIDKFYLADNDEDNDEYNFQFVPVNQFKHIVKDVRRRKTRNEEEQAWSIFVKEQNQLDSNSKQAHCDHKYKPNRTLAESFEDVDRELMRLEMDTLPQPNNSFDCRTSKNKGKNTGTKFERKNLPITKENRTDSASFLLTIPEENKCRHAFESPKSYHQCGHILKKSRSDQTLKNNRLHSKFCHSTDNLDYDFSPRSDLFNENDSIPVRPDPMAVSKILSTQRKISTVLDSISYELDRIPLPDGNDDFLRRQQRIVEFSTRLSRNYLYDLGRQISDIQRHIKAISPDNKMRLNRRGIILHMQIIEQKLMSTHQLLLTALSAYWKHIPSSVLRSHPGKLKDLLQVVFELKNICAEINLTPDFYCSGDNRDTFLGNETENQCSSILSKFRPISDNESQVPSHRTRSTTATPSHAKKLKNRNRQIALSNRFSMYAADMRLGKSFQPKRTRSMFQIPKSKKNNYMSAKQCQSSILPQSKKSSSSIEKMSKENVANKSSKFDVPSKEDDIETMMETVKSDYDAESCKSIKTSKKSKNKTHQSIHIQIKSKESERRLNKNRNDYISEEKLKDDMKKQSCPSSLLPLIGDLLSLVQGGEDNASLPSASIDTLYDFLKTCRSEVETHESQIHSAHDEKKYGEKNMQLICYAPKENEKTKKITIIEECKAFSKFNDAACQINRVKTNSSCELSVSESAASSLIDYRNQYQKMLKSNPLYTSNTQNKPWEVVAWIADQLVDELIVNLCDDFQMEDVIQKLFDMEFQEF